MRKIIAIIIILGSFISYSQNFQLGFRSESYNISVNGVNEKVREQFYPFYSIYLIIGFKLNDNILLENRSGILIEGFGYDGFETGLYSKINLYDKLFYISPGINFHFNSPAERTFSSNNADIINLISLGAGYNFSRTGFIEVSFQKPINNKFGSYIEVINYDPHIEVEKPMAINYLIKFTFGFAWDL